MVKHFKGEASKYIIKYVAGKVKQKGLGIAFFYMGYNTNIVAIPATTIDSNFIFNEISNNYQELVLQGHFTYKITDPMKMALLLDFSIDPSSGGYMSEDPEKLELRIKNVVQIQTRNEITQLDLKDALNASVMLSQKILGIINDAPIITEMGIQVLSISFNAIKPKPEISKALEAEFREELQKKADEAIYARRAAAVEQERTIKENELNNDIALEDKKQKLIELAGKNRTKNAEYNAEASKLELEPYKALTPKQLVALALKDMGRNAKKIGNLTITSEILASILKDAK
jgi:regulator of protease activity HflC (stomatin/prohibitin superfamily)